MQRVHVTIGDTEFTTALLPTDGSYLVPVKVAVQRAEAIAVVLRLSAAGGMTSGWICGSLTTGSLRSRCGRQLRHRAPSGEPMHSG